MREVKEPRLAGSAVAEFSDQIVPLDPEPAVFGAMLEGWAKQQRARFLKEQTIVPRLAVVQRMADFSSLYPWHWQPAEAEAFISHLRSGSQPIAVSTARGYEMAVQLFCTYVTDARYGWPTVCQERFGCS